jgi:hypothetical protein
VITGTGNSASLTIAGAVALAGTFTTGALSFSGSAFPSLSIDTGYSLTVTGTADTTGGQLNASGGSIRIIGTLKGSISATGGGSVQAGSAMGASFGVDATSKAELGTLNSAAVGSFTVDAGVSATLGGAGAQSIVNHGAITAESGGADFFSNQVSNTGTITGFMFHDPDDSIPLVVTNSPTGTITLTDDWIEGSLANAGLLIADKGSSGMGDLVGNVTGTGQIQIGAGATLTTGSVSSGQTLTFTSATGALSLSSSSLDSTHAYGAKIAGFSPGDAIDLAATATSLVFVSSTGILHLNNGSANVANFHLLGDYSGDTFHLTPITGGTQVTVTASAASHGVFASAAEAQMMSWEHLGLTTDFLL